MATLASNIATSTQDMVGAIKKATEGLNLTQTNNPTSNKLINSPVRNVYGAGGDLQNAKNILGSSGGNFNFIDTSKSGFQRPGAFTASDIVLGGEGATGGITGDVGVATRIYGATGSETAQRIQQWATPLTYVNQVNNAINKAAENRPNIPTYDSTGDINNINDIYNKQQEAIQTRLRGQVDTGVANLNRQIEQARPQYQQARNMVDVTYNQQQRASNEQLASQGLARSGKNLTASAILGASRVNQLGVLTSQEQKMVDDANFQIQQLKDKGVTEENAQILELESRKTEALMNARQRDFDRQLQIFELSDKRSQQDLSNIMQGLQFAYGVTKDQANQIFENQKFDYQKAQDLADKLFREAQFDFQKKTTEADQAFRDKQFDAEQAQLAKDNAFRDKQFAEQQAARLSSLAKSSSKGSSGSSSSTGKITAADVENRMWSQFYDAQGKGVGATWLANNKNNLFNSGITDANKTFSEMSDLAEDKEIKKDDNKNNNDSGGSGNDSGKFVGGWVGNAIDWVFGK